MLVTALPTHTFFQNVLISLHQFRKTTQISRLDACEGGFNAGNSILQIRKAYVFSWGNCRYLANVVHGRHSGAGGGGVAIALEVDLCHYWSQHLERHVLTEILPKPVNARADIFQRLMTYRFHNRLHTGLIYSLIHLHLAIEFPSVCAVKGFGDSARAESGPDVHCYVVFPEEGQDLVQDRTVRIVRLVPHHVFQQHAALAARCRIGAVRHHLEIVKLHWN